ncbi:hypothetical protein M6I34_14585 [Burkholderiaceae bacterium FT117]|uniref:hypothetical protein n=1 Tax=Zeimonas sediminis TaxID=2944268 RepID=UPI0023430DF9|nr:hypothetical protein [Zeimonas sediminis]MCM5571745.1 hypothetical protein [Zeimonas sediminis]
MKLRRYFRMLAGTAIGFVAALAVLEAVLRILPIQNGIRAADPDEAWPVHHLVPNTDLTWSAGWDMTHRTYSHTNSSGYVAPFDYVAGTPIVAVLGDSYVESLMNPYPATIQAQLAKRVREGVAVYNFGIGSSALPDYLGVARLVADRYKVEGAVVVVSEGDFVEGFFGHPGHFFWTPDRADEAVALQPDELRSPLKKTLRELALFRYARGNLKLNLNTLFKSHLHDESVGCADDRLSSGDEAVVRAFSDKLPEALGLSPERIVLVFDSQSARRAIYAGPGREGPRSCRTRDGLALELLAREARASGMKTVRMADVFAEHFARTRERVDHSPEDWHWNATGHRLAAAAAARALERGEHVSTGTAH